MIAANGGRGIYSSSAAVANQGNAIILENDTIYGNGTAGAAVGGLEVADADTVVNMTNNIFENNGTVAGAYNVLWAAGSAELTGYHEYNTFYHSNCQGSGTGGPACVSGLTLGSTERSTDPGLTLPGSGNFTIGAGSSAAGTGFPGTITGITGSGYNSMGAEIPKPGGGVSIIGGGGP